MNNWYPTYIAEHEAAHAIVAQKMGLRVAWVTINPDPDVEFFHMAATGIEIEGDDEDMMKLALDVDIVDRDTLLGVVCSMSAPSHLKAHIAVAPGLHHYSQLEADAAYEMGGRGGISFDEIYDATEVALGEGWDEYVDLSQRLVAEGRVVFDTTSA